MGTVSVFGPQSLPVTEKPGLLHRIADALTSWTFPARPHQDVATMTDAQLRDIGLETTGSPQPTPFAGWMA